MTLFVRFTAILTVLMGLAIMAVSAYAAKAEVRRWSPPEGPAGAVQFAESSDAGGRPAVVGLATEGGTATAVSLATEQDTIPPTPPAVLNPAPTFVPSYAAPAQALPVMSTQNLRFNLSPGLRVWRVPSLKPQPAIVSNLGIPADQRAAMQRVSLGTGIPWQIFAAIAKVESNFGRNMATSSAGAIGYGQFLPSTWAVYGNGGDPYDFRDVLPAMGRYLLVAGAPADLPGAIYAYNHSWSYVSLVLSYAANYGYSATS